MKHTYRQRLSLAVYANNVRILFNAPCIEARALLQAISVKAAVYAENHPQGRAQFALVD